MFNKAKVYAQQSTGQLVCQSLKRNQAVLSDSGALVVSTGKFTGRSPGDKFIVLDDLTEETVDWNKFNQPIPEFYFLLLKDALIAHLDDQQEIWTRDCLACADEKYQLGVRVVTETPWANQFAANMLIEPKISIEPGWLILQAPSFEADPKIHGVHSANFTIISFKHQTILIGGSAYTGEIKKGVFTILNFLLPRQKVLPMHCSANVGKAGDTALFFGLSGTGKTTLSADPGRALVGDDEHGWDAEGIFNFEGGCYAKCVNLTEELEPGIFNAIRHGALVENTRFFEGSNQIDFADKTITENTRASYPLSFIENARSPAIAAPPKNIFFLCCDAYGVLPPVSKLDEEQAAYYFLNGYTAKIAGTEHKVTEPQATFSACFGAPFLPLHPKVYADMLKEKLKGSGINVWLVNTGWTGGPYGMGSRIKLEYTRAMIRAAVRGELDRAIYRFDEVFGLRVPQEVKGVHSGLLMPVNTWVNKGAYLKQAAALKRKFEENYARY